MKSGFVPAAPADTAYGRRSDNQDRMFVRLFGGIVLALMCCAPNESRAVWFIFSD